MTSLREAGSLGSALLGYFPQKETFSARVGWRRQCPFSAIFASRLFLACLPPEQKHPSFIPGPSHFLSPNDVFFKGKFILYMRIVCRTLHVDISYPSQKQTRSQISMSKTGRWKNLRVNQEPFTRVQASTEEMNRGYWSCSRFSLLCTQ